MKRLTAGQVPSEEEWIEHLTAFHREVPASTARVACRLRDEFGDTSYDALAKSLSHLADRSPAILDVGCGDGSFVPACRRIRPDASITGVDLSADEISRAQETYGGDRAHFVEGDARALPFADESFDAVVSHFALMLMAPIEPIFRELSRVLKPGGTLAFVIAYMEGDANFDALLTIVRHFIHTRFPNFRYPFIGDERMRDGENVRALLGEAGFSQTSVRQLRVCGRLSKEAVGDLFLLTYVFGALDENDRDALGNLLETRLRTLSNNEGSVRIEMPLQLITARSAR